MPPTRVFLMGMPRMLRDLVRELVLKDAALELVGETGVLNTEAAAAAEPHVVVAGARKVTEGQIRDLLRRDCRIRVIDISDDGAMARLSEMRPHRECLGELGARRLVGMMHGYGARR